MPRTLAMAKRLEAITESSHNRNKTTRGRVGGVAAAKWPGKDAMDQTTDDIGLATPASSPPQPKTAGQQVDDKITDTPNPNPTSAGLVVPADRSHTPSDEPLKLRAGTSVEEGTPQNDKSKTSQPRMPPSEDTSSGES